MIDSLKRLLAPLTVTVACAGLFAQASGDLVEPADVAARLKSDRKPAIFYVGYPVLYRGNHIPGAIFAGPGSKPEGIDALKRAVSKLPKNSEIVLYCGCCPWAQCPNIRPAFRALKGLGYSRVKVIEMPTSFAVDWIHKGYPVEKGPQTGN
jgi:thiosulfate/3-mercaptopyruvate sulfurtransferase